MGLICILRFYVLFSSNIVFPFSFTASDSNRFLWTLDVDPSSASNQPSVKEIQLNSARYQARSLRPISFSNSRHPTPDAASGREAGCRFRGGCGGRICEDIANEFKVKVEVDERIEVAEDPRQLCARLSAVRIAPRAQATDRPNGRGRPKGSKSKPRVEPHFDTSAPPERDEARKARAKMAPRK